jgi:hypothetical protein
LPDHQTYRGVPLAQLRIESIRWTRRSAEHIRTRRRRYPDRPKELDLEPGWAMEAALDPNRLIAMIDGLSIEVVGLSVTAPSRSTGDEERVLKVWLVPESIDDGAWLGVSACAANQEERRAYHHA